MEYKRPQNDFNVVFLKFCQQKNYKYLYRVSQQVK